MQLHCSDMTEALTRTADLILPRARSDMQIRVEAAYERCNKVVLLMGINDHH